MAELQEISKNMHTLMREVEAKLSRQIVIKAQPNGARFRFVALIDDCTLI